MIGKTRGATNRRWKKGPEMRKKNTARCCTKPRQLVSKGRRVKHQGQTRNATHETTRLRDPGTPADRPNTHVRSTTSEHGRLLSHPRQYQFRPPSALFVIWRFRFYRVRSNQPLEPAMATDWSITHSPTPRYLSTHFVISLLSPETFSVLKLGLDGSPEAGGND